MNEFIEKLIGRLEEKKDKLLHDFNTFMDEGKEKLAMLCEVEVEAYSEAISIVNELAEEYNGGWIPTSERLPEKDGYYLITSNGRVYEAYYQDGFWLDPIEFYRVYRSVTAWQPLHAPYQQKGEQYGEKQ